MRKFCNIIIPVILVIHIFSCTTASYKEDPEKYRDDISLLNEQLKNNPTDEKYLRDLGIIYFRIADYAKAKDHLEKAFKINAGDAETILYYGLTLEFIEQKNEAIQVYSNYTNISAISPHRNQIEGRYHWLTRQKILQEMRQLLLEETQLSEKGISPQKIAVFPFRLISGKKEFAALGKGLAEMIITDLSQVKSIHLIERARIQALLEEMALGQTGIIEEKTAPRFGKLLGAGKMVHGSFSIAEKSKINLDVVFLDIINNRFPKFTKMDDVLDNLFKLEKDIVFKIIDQMGIQLTFEEKQKIQLIPTKNIQAFMAYCIGLELQDGGNFTAASEQFNQAYKLDPKFSKARTNSQISGSMSTASGSEKQFAENASTRKIQSIDTIQLVGDRLRNLNTSIGSNFVQGEDSRQAGEEAANAGADIGLTDLPDPPNPPGSN